MATEVLSDFDSAAPAPFEVAGGTLTFDLQPSRGLLHVLVRGGPVPLAVELLVDEKGEKFLAGQGLYWSADGREYASAPLSAPAAGRLRAEVPGGPGDVWLATRLPYGREGLERLLADCCGRRGAVKVRVLAAGGRSFPVFEFPGRGAAQAAPVHWLIAGEDAWETAGSWVADFMVRELAAGGEIAEALLGRAGVNVVPLVSPYSASRPVGSYLAVDGRSLYGAATWGEETPPPEYALLRDQVVRDARAGRLGLLLTIHSWQGAHPFSEMEFLRTAGGREVTGARLDWAEATLARLVRDVPLARGRRAEKIWHPGLARDYMLARHGAITFRIEITTCGQQYAGLGETARSLLRNAAAVEDWRLALPD